MDINEFKCMLSELEHSRRENSLSVLQYNCVTKILIKCALVSYGHDWIDELFEYIIIEGEF